MWNTKMDLFRIYCDLYRIYGQNTFSAITFDWNKILTCSFFCWTLWVQAITQTTQIQLITVIHGM